MYQAMSPFAERRKRVLEQIDGVAIVASAPVAIRNNDVEHDYRQESDLYYLTGLREPDAVLILSAVHDVHHSVIFLRPRDPEREVWDGSRIGVEDAPEKLGVDAAFPIGELRKRLPDYLAGATSVVHTLGQRRGIDDRLLGAIGRVRQRGRNPKPWPETIVHPESVWHEMRLHKDATELELMREAADITAEAHLRAMQEAAPGVHEYEIEASFRDVFIRRGCERAAYGPIIGSGPNACVLHYRENRRRMQEGELLLIDAGCEYEFYACDVTRTFPVSGTFTDAQRALYQVVLDSQLAAIEASRPGATIDGIHDVTVRTLVEGMVSVGLLEGDVDGLIREEKHKRYYMHRTSHWLGLDVHDVGAYYVDGESRPLAPGMVFTIEPGIYVRGDDEEAPERFRGLGIRIEDDVLITEDGHEVLTDAIPKTVADVEAACQA